MNGPFPAGGGDVSNSNVGIAIEERGDDDSECDVDEVAEADCVNCDVECCRDGSRSDRGGDDVREDCPVGSTDGGRDGGEVGS